MPKRTASYRNWLNGKLVDPEIASRYLNVARKDSAAMFFKALRKVAELSQVTKAGGDAGVISDNPKCF